MIRSTRNKLDLIPDRKPPAISIFLLLSGIAMLVICCAQSSPKEMADLTHLQGLSLQEITERLGSPAETQEYTIAEAPTKHWNHGILFETYPKSDPGNLDIRIKELTWQDGDYLIKACFHSVDEEWVALAAIRFHKDIRF